LKLLYKTENIKNKFKKNASVTRELDSQIIIKLKGKAIPVTDHGSQRGCDPHFLDNSEVVSLMQQLLFTPGRFLFTKFCCRLSGPQGHTAAGKVTSIEKILRSQRELSYKQIIYNQLLDGYMKVNVKVSSEEIESQAHKYFFQSQLLMK
jgi:hypothetical protein